MKRKGIEKKDEKRFEAEISTVSYPFDTDYEIREFKDMYKKECIGT